MSAIQTVMDAIGAVASTLFLVVPFSIPVWGVATSIAPGATLMQQSFLFLVISAFTIMTGFGVIVAWGTGWIFIIAIILSYVWELLG